MSRTYGASLSAVSSTEMPTICRPALPYFSWNSTKCGISTLHGPHQVAQKSITTTFPLYWLSETSRLFASFRVKLKLAGLASAGHESFGSTEDEPSPSPTATCGASMAGCDCVSHGICAVTVSAASAAPPRTAIVQRTNMTAPNGSADLQVRLRRV